MLSIDYFSLRHEYIIILLPDKSTKKTCIYKFWKDFLTYTNLHDQPPKWQIPLHIVL